MIVWIDAKNKPLDDTDCLVIYQADDTRALRAPVFWHDEKEQWIDEWGNVLDVVKYALIPELDDGTKFSRIQPIEKEEE